MFNGVTVLDSLLVRTSQELRIVALARGIPLSAKALKAEIVQKLADDDRMKTELASFHTDMPTTTAAAAGQHNVTVDANGNATAVPEKVRISFSFLEIEYVCIFAYV